MRCTTHIVRLPVPLPPQDSPSWQSPLRAFAWGVRSVASTVLTLVLFATYLGIGALAHDTHFSLGWVLAGTALVWAGPAQIILISTLGSGATVVQAAIAVTVSAIRLFPMVVSVLPMIRTPQTKRRHLVLVKHFIAVPLVVECFLLSTARNCRQPADILALVLGLALFPLAATLQTGVDILISGVSAGTIAYGVHWWREHDDPEKWNPVFREHHAHNERTRESDST